MERRDILKAVALGLAGGATGTLAGSIASLATAAEGGKDPLFADGVICRGSSSGGEPAFVAGPRGGLVYRGTHILTHGAFRQLGDMFNARNHAGVTIFGGGCDDGITAVQRGKADLGGMCCPTHQSRARDMAFLPMARDLKVVVTHVNNRLNNISLEALRSVASGKTQRWSQLGGKDHAIALVVRRHCAHFREPVRTALVDSVGLEWSRKALFVDTSEQLVNSVSRYSAAIGVGSWIFAEPLIKRGLLKALRVNGVLPTLTNAVSGSYPLTGPLNVVYQKWNAERMKDFLDFHFSVKGQKLVARRLVPLTAAQAGYDKLRIL